MKRFIFRYILSYIGLVFIKILYSTYRIKIINAQIESDILGKGKRPIYISWHQRFSPGILFLSARKPIAIMVSQSKDGDLMSRIIECFGWLPIRGSSSRGGIKALKQINRLAGSGFSLGHIVDGPRGPHGIVKPGLIMMAKTSGMPILPVIISAEKNWIFKSWDRFIIPRPFSKIIIKFEKEMYIPGRIGKEEIEKYRQSIEEKLYEYYSEADKYWD